MFPEEAEVLGTVVVVVRVAVLPEARAEAEVLGMVVVVQVVGMVVEAMAEARAGDPPYIRFRVPSHTPIRNKDHTVW